MAGRHRRNLAECAKYFEQSPLALSRHQMLQSYMVFGGIPFHLDLMDGRSNLAQNIDRLCFSPTNPLHTEFDKLYRSLFKHADRHIKVVRRYRDYAKRSRDALYQLVDPFTLFYLRFVEKTDDEHFWTKHLLDGGYRAYERNLRNKPAVFARETGTRKALHLTMVTANGIARNQHSGIVQSAVTAEGLFGRGELLRSLIST